MTFFLQWNKIVPIALLERQWLRTESFKLQIGHKSTIKVVHTTCILYIMLYNMCCVNNKLIFKMLIAENLPLWGAVSCCDRDTWVSLIYERIFQALWTEKFKLKRTICSFYTQKHWWFHEESLTSMDLSIPNRFLMFKMFFARIFFFF